MIYAAFTADIIGSAKLELDLRDQINQLMQSEFELLGKKMEMKFPFESIRGDSFQGVASNVEHVFELALLVKSVFKKNLIRFEENRIKKGNASVRRNWRIYNLLDIRISIGIGPIEYMREKLSQSDGTALRLSGHSLDKMKSKNQKLLITTEDEKQNQQFEVELKLLDAVMDKWTPMSAEVVYYLLLNNNEAEIAGLLNISQSAINQRKKTANWEAIEMIKNYYKELIKEICTNT
jgi:hypothetical protein